jgi:hypothetical protein
VKAHKTRILQSKHNRFNPHPTITLDECVLVSKKNIEQSFNPHPAVKLDERLSFVLSWSSSSGFNPHPAVKLDESEQVTPQ